MSEAPQPPPGSSGVPFGSVPPVPSNPPFAKPPPAPPGLPPAPPRFFYPPPPSAPPSSNGTTLLGCGLALSVFLNLAALGIFLLLCVMTSIIGNAANLEGESSIPPPEVKHSGKSDSRNKIAIVSLDGVILEGTLRFVHRQIEQAARDKEVKAVVFRINSPGGTITGSDDLYNRLTRLAQGDPETNAKGKPLVVSMGSMAASGGYYVAMPAQSIFAERTTLTGSIGVYASFPDVAGLAKKYDFGLRTIKQGEIKDSGSPFKEMTPKEVQVWQDMVDHSYDEFLNVVASGRKDKLTRADLLAPITIKPVNAGPKHADNKETKPYQRYRADGGVWTADKALELKLVDQIGTLDDAIAAARDAAELSKDNYKAIRYEKPRTLTERLFGIESSQPASLLEPGRLGAGLMPRLWYLAPGSEVSGILAAAEAK